MILGLSPATLSVRARYWLLDREPQSFFSSWTAGNYVRGERSHSHSSEGGWQGPETPSGTGSGTNAGRVRLETCCATFGGHTGELGSPQSLPDTGERDQRGASYW